MIDTILYLISFVLLLLESLGVSGGRLHFGWLGLAIFVLAALV